MPITYVQNQHSPLEGTISSDDEKKFPQSSLDRRTDVSEKIFTYEAVKQLTKKAVGRLIADAKSGRIDQNRELDEAIQLCVSNTNIGFIRDLKWLLDQQDMERP